MREREITLLLQYILNNKHRLEEELRELEQNSRYRKTTIIDHVEIMLLKQRKEEFDRVTKDIYHLLNLQRYKFDDDDDGREKGEGNPRRGYPPHILHKIRKDFKNERKYDYNL